MASLRSGRAVATHHAHASNCNLFNFMAQILQTSLTGAMREPERGCEQKLLFQPDYYCLIITTCLHPRPLAHLRTVYTVRMHIHQTQGKVIYGCTVALGKVSVSPVRRKIEHNFPSVDWISLCGMVSACMCVHVCVCVCVCFVCLCVRCLSVFVFVFVFVFVCVYKKATTDNSCGQTKE